MNLKSRRARVPVGALATCALVVGGGWLASPASAAETITLLPGATSATITNLDGVGATTATQNAADASYAIKFGGLSGVDLKASVTGTAGGTVKVQRGLANAAPDDGAAWTNVTVGAANAVVVGTTAAASNIFYLQSLTPGTYTVRFFEDTNTNGSYDSSVDTGAPEFTLNVKDVTNATADSADDLTHSVTAPSQILKGEVVAAKASTNLTTSDARGNVTVNSKSVGALGKEISDVLTLAFSGGGLAQAAAATVFDGTTFNRTSNTATTATDVVSSAAIGSLTKTATTVVSDNTVTTLANDNTDTANVDYGAGTAVVRTGTSSVTYKVKATGTGGVAVAGARVFFRVLPDTGGTTAITAADLSTSAGTPDSDGDVSVITGSDGMASLTVTSAKTADLNSYTVAARTNNLSAGTIDAVYDVAETTSVKSGGNVAAKVGTSVQLTGTVFDQWLQPFNPGAGVTAALAYTNNGAGSPTPTSGNFAIGSDGKFSATVSEASSNTTPSTDSYRWTVQGIQSDAGTKAVEWVTSLDASAITLGSIDTVGTGGGADSPFPLESTEQMDIADHSAVHSATLKAVVKGADNNALKYASFTLSGTEGVYFIDADGKAVKTLSARTNASGQVGANEVTDGVEVVFTKTGDAKVTLKSGSVTVDTPTLKVEAATEAWKIELYPAAGRPGTNITVRAQVFDAFGNGTEGTATTFSLPNSSFGTITSTNPKTTDSSGSATVIVTTGANDSGTLDSKAVYGGGGTGTAAGTIGATGLTYAAQVKEATDKIEVGEVELKITSSPQLTYGSKYYARGAQIGGTGADPGATVEYYSKVPGGTYGLIGTSKADEEGNYGIAEKISKSTYFVAKSAGATSNTAATRVYSKVVLTATSGSADRVTLSANGGPNGEAYLYFYRVFANGDTDYLGKKMSNEFGNGSKTFKAPSGNRKYKVTFRSPGTTTGSDTDTVKVK